MKKIVAALSIMMSCLTASANPPIVEVVWPFSAGSTQANMVRHLIESANQQQSTYRFIFSNKPGAGGSVAALHAASADKLTVLASSGSFYTRAMLYNNSHDVDQFQLVSVICHKAPLVLFSRNYTSLADLKNKDVTVGVIPGATSNLTIHLLKKNHPEFKLFNEIPYKGTFESTTDMLSKHIDISVDLPSKDTMTRLLPDTVVLAATGTKSFPNMPSFSSLKINGLENLTADYYIFLPRTVDTKTAQELNKIFNAAINDSVRKSCSDELGTIDLISLAQASKQHDLNKRNWGQMTQGIPKQ